MICYTCSLKQEGGNNNNNNVILSGIGGIVLCGLKL